MGLGQGNASDTPKLHALQVTRSVYGAALPIGAGTFRKELELLWWGDFNANGSAYNTGGKGLGKTGQYDYQAATLGALCQGPLSGIGNVWGQNGRLTLQRVSEVYAVPGGGGSYSVNNLDSYNADQGVGVDTPYSVTANDYGAPGPITLTGVTQLALDVGVTGYTQAAGVYTFPSTSSAVGQNVTISYSFSLYLVNAAEDYQVPNTSPYEITVVNQPLFTQDEGVTFTDTGIALTPVGGTPVASGTYNPNGGDYLFASVDALRPIVINYQWKQSTSSLNPGATLSFTLLEGTQGQAPWTYLTSKHLSQALGYSTIACVGVEKLDLGPSGQMENYNFECEGPFQFGSGIVDADLTVWIENFLVNLLWGVQFPGTIDASLLTIARDYWNANSFFVSPLLDSARPAADAIDEWCEAGNTGVYWSDNSLKFIPYGDTSQVGNGYLFTPQTAPVVDLNDLDFIVEGDEDPVTIGRTAWQDASNEVHIQFENRINNYESDSVILQDDNAVATYGLRPEGQKDYSFLKTIPAANFAASVRLKRLVNIRKTYETKVSGIRYSFLEPMDMVTLTDASLGLVKTPARIIEISEDEKRVYTLKCEEFPWGTATATIFPKQPVLPPPPPPALAQPGDTIVTEIFEPPASVASVVANSLYQIWMSLTGGPNWGGCVVMFSQDGTSYEQIGKQTGTSRGGQITAALPYHTDPDSADTLSVDTSGQLFNVTLEQLNSFATLSKVGEEYLAYQNATLTGVVGLTSSYDLTELRRGVFSTPNIPHLSGEDFVRIDSQLFQYSYNPAIRGTVVYFKFLSFNLMGKLQQGLEDVSAYAYQVGGSNVSQNMTATARPAGGGTWDIDIYQQGQVVGTDGSANFPNGAVLTLPAATVTGLAASTTYWILFNITTGTWSAITSEADYNVDLTLGNFVGIGACTTGSGTAFLAGNPGYTTQGDGTLIEWGTTGTISGSLFVSFPQPMILSKIAVAAQTFGAVDRINYIPSQATSGFTDANNGSGVAASWIAIGSNGSPTPGKTVLLSGTVIQWGSSGAISGSTLITFPTAMASTPCVVVATFGPTDRIPFVTAKSTTGFTVDNNGAGCQVFWIAISSASGSDTLSNGIQINWGNSGLISGSAIVNYGTPFPSNAWAAVASTNGGTDRITFITAFGLSGITIANNGSGVSADYIAIGD
jgi:hypothetical protein